MGDRGTATSLLSPDASADASLRDRDASNLAYALSNAETLQDLDEELTFRGNPRIWRFGSFPDRAAPAKATSSKPSPCALASNR
jgi:hypothetical protein